MDFHTEQQAAEAILDSGVSLPLFTFHFPFRKKMHCLRITIRRPYLGTQIRLAKRWLVTGLSFHDVKDIDKEAQLHLMRDHGRQVARMVAGCIFRGRVGDALLGKLTAAVLMRFADQRHLLAVITRFALLGDVTAFANTIRLAQASSPMTPRLSQTTKTRKGS